MEVHLHYPEIASLLENFQTNEGIKIPESLVPYTGFNIIN